MQQQNLLLASSTERFVGCPFRVHSQVVFSGLQSVSWGRIQGCYIHAPYVRNECRSSTKLGSGWGLLLPKEGSLLAEVVGLLKQKHGGALDS